MDVEEQTHIYIVITDLNLCCLEALDLVEPRT